MTDDGTQERIGLCLSGGGFRASFYALGALRYLAEAGNLRQVDVISAVSGGSIAAASVADGWERFEAGGGDLEAFMREIDAPFRTPVTTKNLRNRWIGSSLVPRPGGRGAALGRTLQKHLYRARRVSELPSRPQVIFTSTDLGVGRAFRIAHDFVGSYDCGYVEPAPDALPLGISVVSSAAFPASLTVVTLRNSDLRLPKAPDKLRLHDGGVYDNLGLEWFQGWGSGRPSSALNPPFKIVVNASGALSRTTRRYGPVKALLRDLSVQYAQTLNLRVRWLVDRLLDPPAGATERGVYIGIGRDPRKYTDAKGKPIDEAYYAGALPSELVEPLALLRTDLDRFVPDEAGLLSYHGYWSLHARLKSFAPDLAVDAPQWNEYANLSPERTRKLLELLRNGSKRKLSRR
jgi:NTE family protein